MQKPFWRNGSRGRLGLVVGFVAGAGMTSSILILKDVSSALVLPRLHEFFTSLQQLVSIPGGIVEEILGYDPPYSERVSAAHWIFIILTNGILVGITGLGIGWILQNRSTFFSATDEMNRTSYSRTLFRFMGIGFLVGLAISLITICALVIPRGETASGWLGMLAWPYVTGLTSSIVHALGGDFESLLRKAPLVVAITIALINGAGLALCGGLVFCMGRFFLRS